MDDCAECREHLIANQHLVGACASVGIEHGLTTSDTLRQYLNGYHARGHSNAARAVLGLPPRRD